MICALSNLRPLIKMLALALFFGQFPLSASNFFSNPTLYSIEEFFLERDKKTLDMCWNFGQGNHFRFISRNDEVYFEICLGVLPDFYKDFLSRVKHKFIEREVEKKLIFSYKIKDDGTEEINQPLRSITKMDPDDSYLVTKRRIFENANPHLMTQEELEKVLRHSTVLFYTGAGLSIASGVPGMKELTELLGLEESNMFFYSLEQAWSNPREFAAKIGFFHRACFDSPPSQAHLALKELAIFKNSQIITENLDCLHELSGIYPYRVNPHQLKDEIGGESLAKFDYVICIGLSFDDRGFLGWYKQQNPNGIIIAVDIQKPSYLGDEDFLVLGNLQEIIPSIQKTIIRLEDIYESERTREISTI